MESLAVDHRVYALDLWGFGDSDKSEKRFNIEHYVALIDAFVEELGIHEPVLVGHALGAVVAVEYAARRTDIVDKVVAVSLPLTPEAVDRRLINAGQSSVLAKVFRWKPIPTKEIEQEAARASETVIARSLESFAGYNFEDKIRTVDCNVLIVFGEKDEVIDSSPAKALNNGLSHIRNISLADSRHFPMVDESTKFNRLLKDFAEKDATLESLALKEEWRRRTR
jgi:pimeloyl-ACP methyl ester carboxylesterase